MRALAKLEQVLPSRLRHRVATLTEFTVPVPGGPRVSADVLVALANACRAHERLRFDYVKHDGTAERREVEPHRLAHARGRWYLIGWDVERGDWRTFRADRVEPRIPTGPRFTPREMPDLPAYVTRGLATATWQFRATVRVHAPAAVIAAKVPAAVVEPDGEDACVLTVGSDNPAMLTLYLGMLDADFEVTGPPELVQALGKTADRFLRAIDTGEHG
ncbi:WYL domain-containing protein [Lentzea tibetensis]|uniref:WYL domain-containing protein n=1 Tax=Lentzea tibetensis TaxID=2591470 RepID=A0A563EQK4_9PSEU|nr:WYL domain-containing protein [Lentzea tibetensis]